MRAVQVFGRDPLRQRHTSANIMKNVKHWQPMKLTCVDPPGCQASSGRADNFNLAKLQIVKNICPATSDN